MISADALARARERMKGGTRVADGFAGIFRCNVGDYIRGIIEADAPPAAFLDPKNPDKAVMILLTESCMIEESSDDERPGWVRRNGKGQYIYERLAQAGERVVLNNHHRMRETLKSPAGSEVGFIITGTKKLKGRNHPLVLVEPYVFSTPQSAAQGAPQLGQGEQGAPF